MVLCGCCCRCSRGVDNFLGLIRSRQKNCNSAQGGAAGGGYDIVYYYIITCDDERSQLNHDAK